MWSLFSCVCLQSRKWLLERKQDRDVEMKPRTKFIWWQGVNICEWICLRFIKPPGQERVKVKTVIYGSLCSRIVDLGLFHCQCGNSKCFRCFCVDKLISVSQSCSLGLAVLHVFDVLLLRHTSFKGACCKAMKTVRNTSKNHINKLVFHIFMFVNYMKTLWMSSNYSTIYLFFLNYTETATVIESISTMATSMEMLFGSSFSHFIFIFFVCTVFSN